MNANVSGSISPLDWIEITGLLGDGVLDLKEINWVKTYSSYVFNGGYQDTDMAAIGYSYRHDTSSPWFALHAGNDTTGWGCHGDYARITWHATFEDAVTSGLTKESRRWLDLPLEGEQ